MPTTRADARSARRKRLLIAASIGLSLVLGVGGTATAVPPPPPNPSDSELDSGRAQERRRAGQVGTLTNRLARAEDRLAKLRDEVALKLELANKARVDMTTAQDVASQSKRDAEAARRESAAAAVGIKKARDRVDEFISGSYTQGTAVDSVSAYIGSSSPQDLLSRSSMLEAVGESELNALEGMRRARLEKANADAAARKAVQVAVQQQRAAERAERAAEAAHTTAIEARTSQVARTQSLEADRDAVQRELFEAQRKVRGLEGQRARYDDWLAAKKREEALKARKAALAAAAAAGGGGGSSAPATGGTTVETVIARAMAQLGVQYAWGGGNINGPTYGIRDGGVADSFGDYNKVGFDCSGLMIYAFAPVKYLPHYSGYQYNSGMKVPLSQARRGDMLFWGNGRIHHVALYLGGGQMIEAPQSGLRVRVAPVRYGDILPYATRLIG